MKTFGSLFRKNLYACLFGPLAIIPASVVYTLVISLFAESSTDYSEFVLFLVLMGLVIAYPLTLFVGLPLTLVLHKIQKFSFFWLTTITVIGVSIFSLTNGIKFGLFAFYLYFSVCVSSACWYLHRVG